MTDGREMTCQEFVELVTDYLEDRMAPADRARFEEHLAICGGCQAYIEQIQGTLRALGRLPREELAAGVRDDVLSAFRDWHTGR
jgi:anti-sigma factor RsiW